MRLRSLFMAVLLLTAASFAWAPPAPDGLRHPLQPQPRASQAVKVPTPHTALEAAWQATIAASPVTRAAHISADAYDLTTDQVLAAIHPTDLQIPASVMKMFTSAAALEDLGPDFSYETRVAVPTGTPAGQAGPIYLVGGGDPWLEAQGNAGLEQLAAQVAREVRSASQVVGVGSLFPAPRSGAGWSAAELSTDYGTGATALEAELSSVELLVQAGPQAGTPVAASLHFLGRIAVPGYFKLQITARTVAGASPPPVVTRLLGSETIVVSGTMQAGTSLAVNISPADPARFAAALFEAALLQQGVRFTSPATSGGLPRGERVIASLRSPPLRLLLPLQNRFSINQMADNLFRTIGLKEAGSGSAAASQAAMASFLRQAGLTGLPPQYDGSGLSPLDLESAQGVVSLLTYAETRPWFPYFRYSMMEAGNRDSQVCGILCGHFVGSPAQDRVWLKTGNLDNQWNYAGYATAANGDLIAFAILEEGPAAGAMADSVPRPSAIDQMVVDLATWPKEPAATPAQASAAPGAPGFLQGVLARLPAATGAVQGVAVLDLATGRMTYRSESGQLVRTNWLPRVGLLAAALTAGVRSFPDVTVAAAGALRGGVLQGPLVLDGALDPSLTPQDLAALAAKVRSAGVRQVHGPLLYVQDLPSAQDALRWPEGATWEELGQSYLPPASRLVDGGDLVQITVQSAGGWVHLGLEPRDVPVKVISLLTTGDGGQGAAATWSAQMSAFVLSGSVAAGASDVLWVTAPDPGLVAATAFRDALAAAGVRVRGGIRPTAGPGSARPVASMPGPSLAALAQPTLSGPSTLDSEQLALLLGSRVGAAMTGVLGPQDIVPDPTGTSFDDYMTPASAVGLLAAIWRDPRDAPLRQALGTNGVWQVQGPGTALLAGYLHGPNGTPYAVAALESGLLWQGGFGETIEAPVP